MMLPASPGDKLVKMREYPLDVFLPRLGSASGSDRRRVTCQAPLADPRHPIIERILNKLARVCDGKIGINLHWKADLLRAWAGASPWRRAHRLLSRGSDPRDGAR